MLGVDVEFKLMVVVVVGVPMVTIGTSLVVLMATGICNYNNISKVKDVSRKEKSTTHRNPI